MDDKEIQVVLAQYEFARDNRISADTTAWEMTSIVWGAQTLLLGFVLEAIINKEAQQLIVYVGVLGILMCIFNQLIMSKRSKVAREMVRICGQIETHLGMGFEPQNRTDRVYGWKNYQSWLFFSINLAFAVMWALVIQQAYHLSHKAPVSLPSGFMGWF